MSASRSFQINTPTSVAAAAAAKAHHTPTSRPSSSSNNANAFASNNNAAASRSPSVNPQISAATQDLLKRVGASSALAGVAQGTPEWEAARQSVMKNMVGAYDTFSAAQNAALRGEINGSPGGDTIAVAGVATTPNSAPRGRGAGGRMGRPPGRGRGRGGGRGRGRKRKRNDSEEEISEDDEDDDGSDFSNSYTPLPSTTRSGRSVTKPISFNPASQHSPLDPSVPHTTTTSRGGGRRRGLPKQYSSASTRPVSLLTNGGASSESILCSKCLRAHSPASNMIVFCDGCNTPWHQWCHFPHISHEAVELPEKEWFCGECESRRELARLPLSSRVARTKENLNEHEQRTYLSSLPNATLVTLLLEGVKSHPDLRLFAPESRVLVNTTLNPHYAGSTSQGASRAASAAAGAQENDTNPIDAYPEFSNELGDPPATYPRPGTGPIKPRAMTSEEDLPFFMDDNSEVFSHLVNDGTGNLVQIDRGGGDWVVTAESGSMGGDDDMVNGKDVVDLNGRADGSNGEESMFAEVVQTS